MPICRYFGLLRKEGNTFFVRFPDFPDYTPPPRRTVKAGEKEAARGLRSHVAALQADGEPLPPPTSEEKLILYPKSANALLVEVVIRIPRTLH
jgi:predicted RNase H-like HicB family nuclease